ncbi:MAG: Z1 domain-containing protein [Urechidicola sp.]|nr:Z1 domain-containing protein [Urechidicola sp.]
MNGYQEIKEFIFNKLKKSNNIDIKLEIENAQKVLNVPEMDLNVFGISDISLGDADWQRMQEELETQFNVKMEQGILIKGKEQQNRDTTWWTGKAQQENESYYWGRYREHLKDSLPPEVVKTINDDTDSVMNNIENPTIENFDRRGMVVGHVQSGKTGNYAGLICKAADVGYKFIVVIAGGINNLRDQTQARLNESFIGKDGGAQIGVGKGDAKNDKLPISLTTKEKDFNKQDADRNAQGLNFEVIKTPVILVIKKNIHSLKNVIDWLDKQYPNKVENHAMLMIDDESDYASIDTSKAENEPTAINKGLRKILAKFNKSIYVAYTATPYANIFIDHQSGHEEYEDDLFPRDFIYALSAPDNYFGAREIFLDNDRKYLVSIDDYQDIIPAKHKKDFDLPSIPKSLYEAMRVFFLNIAIRYLRGQNKHNSMLIHATRFTAVHQKLAFRVSQYLEQIQKEVNVYGRLPNANQQSSLIQCLEHTLNTKYSDLDFSWQEVLLSLCNIVNTVVYREVHQQTSVKLEYRNDVVTNAIVVGGTSLSRGYTLEGLSVSYFLRSTVFYDTLMQMGRWFGYREGYQDLCKVYMPETMIDNFGHIIDATEDLFADFKKMSDKNMTPKDFGLAVKSHPDSILQVTARNKQRNVTEFMHSMCLDGRSKETSWLSSKSEHIQSNLLTLEKTINQLQNYSQFEKIGNNYLWREVDKQQIIDFLSNFKVYQNDAYGISSRMPINFIKEYAEDIKTNWDVALYSGGGKNEKIANIEFKREQRKVRLNNDCIEIQNRQVSTGTSESISLDRQTRKELGSNRKQVREKIEKPLLRLHILETQESERLSAFGVSFPSKIISNTQNIKLKINTVYQQQLLDFLQYEEQSDD